MFQPKKIDFDDDFFGQIQENAKGEELDSRLSKHKMPLPFRKSLGFVGVVFRLERSLLNPKTSCRANRASSLAKDASQQHRVKNNLRVRHIYMTIVYTWGLLYI